LTDNTVAEEVMSMTVSKDEGASRDHWTILRDAADAAPQDEVRIL